MGIFHNLLTFTNKYLIDEEDKAGILTRVKESICDTINIYIEKYSEEFLNYIEVFAKNIWDLLIKTGLDMKYDKLVSKCIHYITNVCKSEKYTIFGNEKILNQICENIIIPNISLRENDEELFEDDPIEYIRRDIEGSDSDTRRKSASELVQGLSYRYEMEVTKILLSKVTQLLKDYTSDTKKWKYKDIAIYLLIAVAVKGKTEKKGATQVSDQINITDFFGKFIVNELKGDNLILRADSIKYVTIFRNQVIQILTQVTKKRNYRICSSAFD
jgi:exportin-2 (importin alpha re-exporter)